MNYRSTIILLVIFVSFSAINADVDCSRFFIRAKIYSIGDFKIGYLGSWEDNLEGQYKCYKIGTCFDGISREPQCFSGKNILYLNRIKPKLTFDDKGRKSKNMPINDSIVIADSLFSLKYQGKILLHYVIGNKIRMTDIDVIEMDSILWANEYYQEQWVDSSMANVFKKSKIVFVDTLEYNSEGGSHHISMISFDSTWSILRYRKLFNRKPFDSASNFPFSLKWFHPDIQNAIKNRKLFVFEQFSP